jgi:DNA primase
MVKEFRLGYAPEGWNNLVSHCASISINTEKLAACGLVVTSATAAYDRFRNRVMFPIFDISGKPIAFGGRALDNETKPKYLNSSETILYQKNRVLYGLSHARATIKEKGYVIFVEGYMDFLSLYQAGIKNAVATSGTALTEEHGHLIRRFTSKIVLVFDGDNAGVAAAERAIFILLPLNLDVCVLVLPQEHDPDTFIQEFSTTVFLEKIAQAETGIRFYLKRIMQQYDAKSATGKSEVIHHIAPLIKALSDEIVRAEVIKEVSQELGIKETILYSKLKPVLKNLGTESTQQPSPMAAQKLLATEEGHFLQILVKDPSLIPTVLKYISSETFLENNSGKLYSLITETFSVDKTLQTLFSRTTDGELRQILSLMAVKELPPGDLNEEITHKVKRFILKVYTAKKHQITQLIRKENNQELKAKLLQKQNDLITKYGAISKEW